MRRLDVSFDDTAWHLACDEAMLEWCENTAQTELLRLWEPAHPAVVLGVGNRAALEADLGACRARGISILRRCSGGGAVLQAPGCLNFTLVLEMEPGRNWLDIEATHRRVLGRHQTLLNNLLRQRVDIQGTSDLALGALKVSGNAQRRRRRFALYHGTFLLSLDMALLEEVLKLPSRQPDYRAGRPHRDFLTTLPLLRKQLVDGLVQTWGAMTLLPSFPQDRIETLVREKYGRPEWNLRF